MAKSGTNRLIQSENAAKKQSAAALNEELRGKANEKALALTKAGPSYKGKKK